MRPAARGGKVTASRSVARKKTQVCLDVVNTLCDPEISGRISIELLGTANASTHEWLNVPVVSRSLLYFQKAQIEISGIEGQLKAGATL